MNERYRLVAMDMLGFGFSDKPRNHAYSIFEQADLVEALLSKLGIHRYHVLSHDYGDTVAQELLARDNQRNPQDQQWQSLCLLNGGIFPEVHRPRLIQKLLISPLGLLVSLLFSKKTLSKNFVQIFGANTPPSVDELEAFWQLICVNDGHRLSHKLIHYMTERKQHRQRWVQALVDSHVDQTFINGLDDPISGEHMVARYRDIVKKGTVCELPGIGHYPQVEAPDVLLAHYFEFLNMVESKA